jgi:hypothetical protein
MTLRRLILIPALVLPLGLSACGGSSAKKTPAFKHVQAAEIATMHAHPNPKHHLRVSCSGGACTARLRLRDRVHTVVATDHWAVHGASATLQGPSAIAKFLAADATKNCTQRFFAVIAETGHPAPGVGAEKAALVRALAPCGG